MNTIFIHDFRLPARIGVYDWEKRMPQTVRLDLEIGLPSERAFATGHFADTIDYAAIVDRLRAFAAGHPPPLLERFAQCVADIVLGEFGATFVKVRVAKPAALPGVREVGVSIERERR